MRVKMWIASIHGGGRALAFPTKVGYGSMNEFQEWARSTYRQSGIDVNEDDLELIELVYSSALRQLDALDHIDLEKFPALGVDLRHAPKTS